MKKIQTPISDDVVNDAFDREPDAYWMEYRLKL